MVGTRFVVVVAAFGLAALGCSDPTCQDLYDRYGAAAAAVDRACETRDDCVAIGGTLGEYCTCTLVLPSNGVNRAAYYESGVPALQRDYLERCDGPGGGPRTCDVSGIDLDCVGGQCRVVEEEGCDVSWDDSFGSCNPVAQTGCIQNEKCTWIWVDAANDVGFVDCRTEGSVPLGEACAFGPDGQVTGYDDCVAGAICVDSTCASICNQSPDTCTAPNTCSAIPGVFPDTSNWGACVPPS